MLRIRPCLRLANVPGVGEGYLRKYRPVKKVITFHRGEFNDAHALFR